MRFWVIVSLLGLGCSKPTSTEAGRLVCRTDGKTFEARVPAGALSSVRERADQAQLTDCHFEPGAARLARYPVEIALPPPPPPPDDDLLGGVVGGVAPPPAAVMTVPPSTLENNRIAGVKQIEPDPDTQLEIQRSGKDKVIGSFKLCIDTTGKVSSVSQLKTTGFSAYDAKIIRGLEMWRYMPYVYNGRVTAVCTAVTFIFSAQ